MKKKSVIILLLLVVAVGAGFYLFMPKSQNEEPVIFETTTVAKGQIAQSVTATGTIEPVTQVDVGTQVSGILTTLYVDYNSEVKKGQVIAELDKSTLILDYNSNKNNVEVAKSKYQYELSNYTRIKTLHEKELIADSEYESALYSYETAKNDLEIAKNDLKRSETNLGYATIYSPIDGVVLSKDVEEGQTVASSFSTPTLFSVAADLKDMRVIVDVDEADIGGVKEGQSAKFTVDAFPLDSFEGTVTQVRQEATIESNVVTYEVVISAANPDLKLKPGLTANVEIFILDEMCDMVIPMAALSFTPTKPEGAREGEDRPERADHGDREPIQGDKVWVKSGDRMEPRAVTVGVQNGILAQVDGLEIGEEVITSMEIVVERMPEGGGRGSQESSPFMPTPPGRK